MPSRRSRLGFPAFAVAAACLALAGCQPKADDRAVRVDPVPSPELNEHAPSVREAVAAAQQATQRAQAQRAPRLEQARAQGELAMTCHAHGLTGCADAAYRNARRLAPDDLRWPYLQGHLHADAARLEQAVEAFQAALGIAPDDAAALFSLGEVQLKRGAAAEARTLFQALLARPDARAAALAGLGKAELALRDHRAAIAHLQEALQLAPSAHRLRYPLAMAWRAVGDERQAAEVLRGYAPHGVEPTPPDPAVEAMAAKVASPQGLLRRGQRHAAAGRFDVALAAFEAGVKAEPAHVELQTNLGIALANLGRVDEARRVLSQVLAREPGHAFAHATLGALADRAGRDAEAVTHYEAALAADADNDAVRLQLADARMRMSQPAQAAMLYTEQVRRTPTPRACMSLAMALVRQGRYGDARKALDQGLALHPDHPTLSNALARLLAASPQTGLRNGPRALAIARGLAERTAHPEVLQTYAMALAAAGDFDQAVHVQQRIVEAHARSAAPPATGTFLQATLQRYRAREAAARPWGDDDPIFRPRSRTVTLAPGASG